MRNLKDLLLQGACRGCFRDTLRIALMCFSDFQQDSIPCLVRDATEKVLLVDLYSFKRLHDSVSRHFRVPGKDSALAPVKEAFKFKSIKRMVVALLHGYSRPPPVLIFIVCGELLPKQVVDLTRPL